MTKKEKYTILGKDLDPAAISQMDDAISLPISIKGALMTDAHKKLETKNQEIILQSSAN